MRLEARGALVVAGLTFGVGFLPLFGAPGYEQSLAAGLIVPTTAAVTAAMVARARTQGRTTDTPLAALGRGALLGVVFAAIAFVAALVHGVRVGFCDLCGGTVYFLLTAASGSVLGGTWGVVAGELAGKRSRWVAVVLAVAAPLGNALLSVLRFYTSPIIFAFDPFVGFFSGTLYDTVIDETGELLTYRAGSLATLGCGFFLASLLDRDERGHLVFVAAARIRSLGGGARLGLGVVCLSVSLAITAAGSTLGHWQTASTIREALGGSREGARCTVVYPAGVRDDDAALLLEDCEEELAADETVLGLTADEGPARVTAFFFRDAAEKRHLMGAADTYIAKPWRDEVYLQMAAYPHPVLGHEMAHVVSGSFGRGPFRIAGALGGLWPNPGMIEGVAVATSPDDDELTDAEWSRAMLDIGILPPIERIFSFGFLGESSAKSYTVAGAFVRFLLDTRGAPRVRAWYAGALPERALGGSLAALDAEFRASLAGFTLSPQTLAYARAKFARPSVFGRTCPHEVDAVRRRADACRDGAEYLRAADLYRDVLARDPHDWAAKQGLAALELRFLDGASRVDGEHALSALASDSAAPAPARERASETLADQLWLSAASRADEDDAARDGAKASLMYRELAATAQDEDRGRTLDVKALAAADLSLGSVRELLVGSHDRAVDPPVALALLGARGASEPRSPLVDYLLAKNLIAHGRFTEASSLFNETLGASILPDRIRRESFREQAVAACASKDTAAIARLKVDLAFPSSPFAAHEGGRYDSVARLLSRCH